MKAPTIAEHVALAIALFGTSEQVCEHLTLSEEDLIELCKADDVRREIERVGKNATRYVLEIKARQYNRTLVEKAHEMLKAGRGHECRSLLITAEKASKTLIEDAQSRREFAFKKASKTSKAISADLAQKLQDEFNAFLLENQ